jgi:hypothetical protein
MAASNVFRAMPLTRTIGDGIYTVDVAESGPYRKKLTVNDRVGTTTYPYLPSCEPAYIPVLYYNVGTINDDLISINATVVDHTSTIAGHAETITNVVGSTPIGSNTITGLIGNTSLVTGGTITGLIGNDPIDGTITSNITNINTTIGNTSLVTGGTITGLIGDNVISGTITSNITSITSSITNINTSIGTANITGSSITAAIEILQAASSTGSSGCSTQVLGTTTASVITGVTISSDYIVDAISNTTVISSINKVSTSVKATYTYTDSGGTQILKTPIAIYEMTAYDIKQFGCSKTVMFTAADWVNVFGVTKIDLGQLAFLYAGTDNYFLVNGSKQQFYQFLYIGDFVTFQMLTTDGSTWQFVVTNSKSTFYPNISLNREQARDIVITDERLSSLIVISQ